MRAFACASGPLLLVVALAASLGALAGVLATVALQSPAHREIPLYATASDTGSGMSMATGPIDGEMEGVFFLEFATGRLTAVVLSPRDPSAIIGLFHADVAKDIGAAAEKKPSYLMVAGHANLVGKVVGGIQPGKCIVYVLDQNSGNFVGYGLKWNATLARADKPQGDALLPVIKQNISAVEAE